MDSNQADLLQQRNAELEKDLAVKDRALQIEAALEKVRARTMEMHRSSELAEAATLLFGQLSQLGASIWICGFCICQKDNQVVEKWVSPPDGKMMDPVYIPYTIDEFERHAYEAWKTGLEIYSDIVEGTELQESHEQLLEHPSMQKAKNYLIENNIPMPTWVQRYAVTYKHGYLMVVTLKQFEETHILVRFARVFEQTYTRFLDLIKAEAQTREAQIELALERVRARTMAMQKSEELPEAAKLLFQQIQSLGLPVLSCGYNIFAKDDLVCTAWMSDSSGNILPSFPIPLTESPTFIRFRESRQKGEPFYAEEVSGEILANHYRYMFSLPGFREIGEGFRRAGFSLPSYQVNYVVNFSHGNLIFIITQPVPEAWGIFKRFAAVFDQTYTRFLDLQRAEAQAREATIEVVLEKIRSRSLAMHHSNELISVIGVMFEKLKELNVLLGTVAIWLFNKATMDSIFWVGNNWQQPAMVHLPYDEQLIKEDTNYRDSWEAWLTGESYINKEYNLEQKDKYFRYVFAHNDLVAIPAAAREMLMQGQKYIACLLVEKNSTLYFDCWNGATYNEESIEVLKRVARVFEQAYVRFLDLQKVEAQAREAQIELALEKVRARAMAMQRSNELSEAAKLLYDELRTLNINPVTCGYAFIIEEQQTQTVWVTLPDGTLLPDYIVFPLTGDQILNDRYKGWKKKVPLHKASLEGEVNKEHHRFLSSQVPENVSTEIFEHIPENIVFYSANFSAGYLMIIAIESFSAEDEQTIIRFAKVFEITYTRFLDLQRAEAQAREAQIELAMERVRARTMAMQKSAELNEVAALLFKQVAELGIKAWTTGFNVWSDDNNSFTDYITSPQGGFIEPYTVAAPLPILGDARKRGEEFLVFPLEGEILREVYQELSKFGDKQQFEKMVEGGFQLPERQFNHFVFGAKVSLMFITYEPIPEAHDIFKRFGKVFEQTYTRFLDLQKAEAQAREAQIEVAVERVRAKALAMHRSEEIMSVVQTLRLELGRLNIEGIFAASIHLKQDDGSVRLWDITINDVFDNAPTSSWDFNFRLEEMHSRLYIKRIWDATQKYFVFEQEEHDFPILIEWVRQFKKEDADDIDRAIKEYNIKRTWFAAIQLDYGRMNIELLVPPSAEVESILFKMGAAFDLAYKRFLDLKKAEAQAREAQIELALEKVRARTMAMQKSEELADAAVLLFQQVKSFGLQSWGCGFNIWEKDDNEFTGWMSSPEGKLVPPSRISLNEHPLFIGYKESRQNGVDFYVLQREGKELEEFYQYLLRIPVLGEEMKEFLKAGGQLPTFQIDHVVNFSHGNLIFITYEPVSEAHDIFKRFGKVFEQTYSRFLDLQRAEAQAREAQIQLALERVRARTMAMQKSNELAEVATLLFKQVAALGIKAWTTGFNVWSDDNNYWTDYVTNPEGGFIEPYTIDTTKHSAFANVSEAKKKGEEFYVQCQEGEMLTETYRHLSTFADKNQFKKMLDGGFQFPRQQFDHFVFGSKVSLLFITYEPVPEAHDIFKRFGKVFEQTYTRFLDLKRAEAQAKEARIEAALERVRSRSMAMQKSDEVMNVAVTVYDQLQKLDFSLGETSAATIIIMDKKTGNMEHWLAGFLQKDHVKSYQVNNSEHPLHSAQLAAWREGAKFISIELSGPALESYAKEMFMQTGYRDLPDEEKEMLSAQEHVVFNLAYMSHGALMWAPSALSDVDAIILQRFAKVFEQTYTRFLDLQKAEAQAREAQIELGLERVRARAMAMQKSNELVVLIDMVQKELTKLEFALNNCIFWIMNEEPPSATWWVGPVHKTSLPESYLVPFAELPLFNSASKAWKERVPKWVYELEGQDKKNTDQYIFTNTDVSRFPDDVKRAFEESEKVYISFSFYNYGGLHLSTPQPLRDEQLEILNRFSKVFDQTYTRFLDLQKAEAQARESQIQLALERVRARTMAMYKSDELADAAEVLFKQIVDLGNKTDRLSINLIDEEQCICDIWATDQKGVSLKVRFEGDLNERTTFKKLYEAWKMKYKSMVVHLRGEELREWLSYVRQKIGLAIDDIYVHANRYHNVAFFSSGWMMFSTGEPVDKETMLILERFASVFNLTYTRFLDLQKAEALAVRAEQDLIEIKAARKKAEDTLTELKATQAQLIQAEKMASLGELTAGIAHEIQNPLNFVNNFSEVNRELIEELKSEKSKVKSERNEQVEDELINDIAENEQKINHHGKRADAIVKGMLQHSRASTGKKEPTDINALADECLRLSYHGLRAKDKSFNATIETHFDESIGKIEVIPQDIGRVFLNLFSNAFYAVSQKKKQQDSPHFKNVASQNEVSEPTVSVSTKREGDKVIIVVRDNGVGIPQKAVDKIFQPFYTTKPTGQGTGLGLSLTYDIIKAHGAELNVDTKEGEYAKFTISLFTSDSI